jgi:hypothetical protein
MAGNGSTAFGNPPPPPEGNSYQSTQPAGKLSSFVFNLFFKGKMECARVIIISVGDIPSCSFHPYTIFFMA